MFLGASDGFALTTRSGKRVACCTTAWRREYARRARRMIWQGRRVRARTNDGIHLSEDGADIAASLVVERMRADGLID